MDFIIQLLSLLAVLLIIAYMGMCISFRYQEKKYKKILEQAFLEQVQNIRRKSLSATDNTYE